MITGEDVIARLAELRSRIDEIDLRLLRDLNERLELGRQIGAVKREANLPVSDPAREAAVLESAAAEAERLGGLLSAEDAAEAMQLFIRLTRNAQLTTALSGEGGVNGSERHSAEGCAARAAS